MAIRTMITIDESKCNGCGNCITGCAEGALRLVNGKAKLVKEQFCDGFGDCIGHCPTGALTLVEREADAFDETATRRHLLETQGPDAVQRMDAANEAHARGEHPPAPGPAGPRDGGCPGMRPRQPARNANPAPATPVADGGAGLPGRVMPADLAQWPVQLHLVQPGASFFQGRELAILSTCSPVASADIHWRFMRGRGVVMACPKLDRTDPYVEKLAAIFRDPSIPKAVVVRMEVPCCGGLTRMVVEAWRLSGRTDLAIEEITVSLDGEVIATKPL